MVNKYVIIFKKKKKNATLFKRARKKMKEKVYYWIYNLANSLSSLFSLHLKVNVKSIIYHD